MIINGIVCGLCGAMSWSPTDAAERYCGRCRRYRTAPGEMATIEIDTVCATCVKGITDVRWPTATGHRFRVHDSTFVLTVLYEDGIWHVVYDECGHRVYGRLDTAATLRP